jgi:hypothetical protein
MNKQLLLSILLSIAFISNIYADTNISERADKATKTITKICICDCNGIPELKTLSWNCGQQPEPPCDCCPCDLNDCPAPNIRVRFNIVTFGFAGDYTGKMKLFSDIVIRHKGKTCCEDFLMQNPGAFKSCQNNNNASINTCIPPSEIENIRNEALANGFDQVTYSYNISDDCNCPTK